MTCINEEFERQALEKIDELEHKLETAMAKLALAQSEIRELKEVVIPNGRELLEIQTGYTGEAQAERDRYVNLLQPFATGKFSTCSGPFISVIQKGCGDCDICRARAAMEEK